MTASYEPTTEPRESAVHQLADHLFRHESGKIISILTGIYGTNRLQLAEDVVQEALIRALRAWPFGGIPDNPTAWLLRTAKNLALDQLRREQNFQRKQPEIVVELEQTAEAPPDDETEVRDDQLRLMFVCCHPALSPEIQTALALKTLCGFSPAEIARAYLISEAAMSKRLTRARQKLQSARVPFEIPSGSELPARLEGVLKIIYLLFTEGHKASEGEQIIRGEFCAEAIRLALLLAEHSAGNQPATHALLALMFLTSARFPSRSDVAGNLLRLEEQDRSLWDQGSISHGLLHLAKSGRGDQPTEYHLQAGIAACHTLAPSDSATDWPQILALYDQLSQLHDSPVIALNRAVAVSKVDGPDKALQAIEVASLLERLEGYYLLHAVLGELEWKRGDKKTAAAHFSKALDLTETKPERILFSKRLDECLAKVGR